MIELSVNLKSISVYHCGRHVPYFRISVCYLSFPVLFLHNVQMSSSSWLNSNEGSESYVSLSFVCLTRIIFVLYL